MIRPRSLRSTAAALGATIALLACGGGAIETESIETESIATAPVDDERPGASSRVTVATIARIDEPATVTTVAERVDDAFRITWIGGSEIDLDGRSLPVAVSALEPTVGERPLHVFADTKIAPLPGEVTDRVRRATERNVDGLVVILNPSWLSWDGHTQCSGIADPHEYYACVLTPLPQTDVGQLRADVAELIDTIVATGVPAYVYVIPHSAESLADPTLAPVLAAAEAQFAELDPGLDRIEFVDHIVSRDLPPLREGIEFLDMVHPDDLGIERLADFFSGEFARVFAAQAPA